MVASVSALLQGVDSGKLCFKDVINYIETRYVYVPVAFDNGYLHNAAGQNEGSCKVFYFARLHGLNELDTLALFAEHWRAVQQTPQAEDHQNIRNFKKMGWSAVFFTEAALLTKGL